jgi:hypothetical protein
MLRTLKAVVHGDKIRWQEAAESVLPTDAPVDVLVTILEAHPNWISADEQGRRRVVALQKLVGLNAFSGITDPGQWQAEAREDRELPARES